MEPQNHSSPQRNINGIQIPSLTAIKRVEQQLDDVMELTDIEQVKRQLAEVERQSKYDRTEVSEARLGIIYHEVALNLSFLSKSDYKGYAGKSFRQLTQLANSPLTPVAMMPFVVSYRASALALMAAETRKLRLVNEAFIIFKEAVEAYGDVSPVPEFLRASVSENLPWLFFAKKRFARIDFHSIINKQLVNPNYASPRLMSFTYYAWAKHHQKKKYRTQAMQYLNKAIQLDLHDNAGAAKAQLLKIKLLR